MTRTGAGLIEIEDLSVAFTGEQRQIVEVVSGVSLAVARGEALGVVGESGSGKSTVALALLGFLRPGGMLRGGAVRYLGQDLFRLAPRDLQHIRGSRIALVPQNAGQSLTPTLPVGAQIVEALVSHRRQSRAQARAQAVELLGQVKLPDPRALALRYPHELSGGQQQRVAIAMALAGEPELLVLDEPTTGLDVTTQAHILQLLKEIRERTGAALVCVSHDLGVIASLSDRLAVMYAGRLVELGSAEAAFARPCHPYTRGLLASVPRLAEAGLPAPLPGQAPSPAQRFSGCAFAPRCGFADERCEREAPGLAECSSGGMPAGHLARCHHWPQILAAAMPERRSPAGGRGRRRPAASAGPPVLEVVQLAASYRRGGLRAVVAGLTGQAEPPPTVAEIDLQVARGGTLALVGESGSGKSTMARLIAGLHEPSAGRIAFGGSNLAPGVDQRTPANRQAIQIIFQNPDASLNPRHTIQQILEQPLLLFFRLGPAQRRERMIALLKQVRLGAGYLGRYPGQLSGGEKQRVAIARAFAAEPELVLCDEVTSALDVSVQAAVLDLLAELQAAREVTYIFISHDLAVVRAVADTVAIIYQGRLCEVGPAARVFAPPSHPYTETLLAAVLEPIPGRAFRRLAASDIPEAGPPPRGCPFQRRCPRRLGPVCDHTPPPWQATPEGNAIRCHIPLAELAEPLPAGPEARPAQGG